jgi:CRP-like cAMP-binding protein
VVSVSVLRRLGFLDELTSDELNKVADIADEATLRSGQRVFSEGMHARDIYVLLEGAVEIRMRRDSRTEAFTVATIEPGEIFGWSALIEPFSLTASAEVTEKSRVMSIHGGALRDLFEENPRVGYLFMKEINRIVGSRLRNLRRATSGMLGSGGESAILG